jgi:hypothetical protein
VRRRPGPGLLVACVLALLLVSCATRNKWHVPKGYESKYRRDHKVCRQLTDANDGEQRDDRLESCMKRRGWRYERFYDGMGVDMKWF